MPTTMEPDHRDMVSHLHDKMGMKRRVRRREGTESKRVANAIHAIKGARTNDGPDQESRTASPIVTNSTSGSPSRRYKIEDESGDENDKYDNEAIYAPIEEDIVYEDVYIEEIDESGHDDEEPSDTEYEDVEELVEEVLEEEVHEDEDESEVSETEGNDETEFDFDEQEEMGPGSISILEEEVLEDGEDEKEVSETEVNDETEFEFDEQDEIGPGSISIDETETEAGLDVVEVLSREKTERWAVEEVVEEDYDEIDEEVLEEKGEAAEEWNIEEVLEEKGEAAEEWNIEEVLKEKGEAAEEWNIEEVLEEDAIDEIESEIEVDVIEESQIVETPAEVGANAAGDTAADDLNESCDRADVLEAISYILKQEKAVRKEILTQDQVQDIMNLPLAELLEVLEHFEVSDNSSTPIRWDLVMEKVEANQGTEDFDAYQGSEDKNEIKIGEDAEDIVTNTDETEIVGEENEIEIFEDEDEVEIFEDDDEVEIFEDDDEVEIFEEEDEGEIAEEEDEVEIVEEEDETEIVEEEDEIEIAEEDDEVDIVEAKDESDYGESEDESDCDESSDSSYDHLNSDVTGDDALEGQGYSLEAVSAGYMSSINNDLTEVSEGDGANIDDVVFSIDEPKLRELILADDRGEGDIKRRSSREPGEMRGEGDKTKQIRKKGSRGKPKNDFFI
jgi:hypothetical protein